MRAWRNPSLQASQEPCHTTETHEKEFLKPVYEKHDSGHDAHDRESPSSHPSYFHVFSPLYSEAVN